MIAMGRLILYLSFLVKDFPPSKRLISAKPMMLIALPPAMHALALAEGTTFLVAARTVVNVDIPVRLCVCLSSAVYPEIGVAALISVATIATLNARTAPFVKPFPFQVRCMKPSKPTLTVSIIRFVLCKMPGTY